MTHRFWTVLALVLVAASGVDAQEQGFPHARHARLFPLCVACHNVEGEAASRYPAPGICAGCHNGTEQPVVTWQPPAPEPTLLRFSHSRHEIRAAADSLVCQSCHVRTGEERMAVANRAIVGQCLACHGHPAERHLTGAPCTTCHVPLANSSLDAAHVSSLPRPPSHRAGDFVLSHGSITGAECTICHTRERCETCHVNAATLEAVRAMPPAGAAVELPAWTPEYPTPADHQTGDWLALHGTDAQTPASCSTCHTRDSCSTCHVETPPAAIARLPGASHVQAQGVTTTRSAPESHALPTFPTAHAPFAETAATSCTACHGRTECTACHDAARGPGFHPANFLERHPAEAFARRLECANCHDSEVFCASCHATVGRASSGVTGAVYHDAEAAWLLRHGQAARQGLESCVGCHRPPDCLRCHSQLGAFQVSPHGPDFDPELARSRNAFVCRTCHIRDPLRSGGS